MKKISLFGVAMVVLSFAAGIAISQTDPRQSVGRLDWLSSGALKFVQRMNSSDQMVIYNEGTGDNSLLIDDGDGALYPRTRTAAQIKSLTPAAANGILINSDSNTMCLSTGTGQGAWVYISSAVTGSVFTPCWKQ